MSDRQLIENATALAGHARALARLQTADPSDQQATAAALLAAAAVSVCRRSSNPVRAMDLIIQALASTRDMMAARLGGARTAAGAQVVDTTRAQSLKFARDEDTALLEQLNRRLADVTQQLEQAHRKITELAAAAAEK